MSYLKQKLMPHEAHDEKIQLRSKEEAMEMDSQFGETAQCQHAKFEELTRRV